MCTQSHIVYNVGISEDQSPAECRIWVILSIRVSARSATQCDELECKVFSWHLNGTERSALCTPDFPTSTAVTSALRLGAFLGVNDHSSGRALRRSSSSSVYVTA